MIIPTSLDDVTFLTNSSFSLYNRVPEKRVKLKQYEPRAIFNFLVRNRLYNKVLY